MQVCFAKPAKKTEEDKNFADYTHDFLSSNILSFSESIDQFFSNQRSNDVINTSQLRLSAFTRKEENLNPTVTGDLQFNLILPRTQKKMQLFVEGQGSDDDRDTSAKDKATTAAGNTPNNQDPSERIANATTAGLRYIVDTAGIKTSTDAGVRVNLPPQLFARLRLTKDVKINSDWTFRPREQVLWVDREGFSSTTNLDFDNKLNLDLLLRFVNRVSWSEDNYAVVFTNGPSLFQRIDDAKGFSYHAHVISVNQPNYAVEKYVATISYRQLLYKTWFFWEVAPQLDFSRANNFHRKPSLSVEFEIVLGNI